MLRHLTILPVLAVLASTHPLAAQEQQQDTGAGSGTNAGAPSVLDLGQPVDNTPQPGQRYSKEKFGDWELACIKTTEGDDPCSLFQVLKDESGNAVAEVSLFRLEGNGQAVAGATVVVPLETLLPAQLTISVDGASGKRYNYSFCNQVGCVAQIGLTASDIDSFVKGHGATVSLVPAKAPDQTVVLNMSLKGFTAGYGVVDVVKN